MEVTLLQLAEVFYARPLYTKLGRKGFYVMNRKMLNYLKCRLSHLTENNMYHY